MPSSLPRDEWGLRLPGNPVSAASKVVVRNARDRRLIDGEWEALDAALTKASKPLLRSIVHFAVQTGMRRGEILNLRWRHVNLGQRTAHIPESKTGVSRTIPLTDGAIDVLRSQREVRHEIVFPMSPNAVRLAWVRAVRRAGLMDLHFHDLRHEAISRFFELGLSLPEVAVISGHRDPRMLFRYTHLRPSDLAEKLRGKQWEFAARTPAEAGVEPLAA